MRLAPSLFTPNPIKTSLLSLSPHSLSKKKKNSLILILILLFPSPISLSFSSSSLFSRLISPARSRSDLLRSESKSPIMTTSVSFKPPMIGGAEVGTSGTFWIKFRRESNLALCTPFLVSLAAGNLSIDSFRHYVSQDVHFLRAFAQSFLLAEECADDDDAKIAIAQLRKGVLKDLKTHDSFVQEWDSDLIKDSHLNPATTKYTEFLLATALGKIVGAKGAAKLATPFEKTKIASYTLSVVTSFMRLYALIGKELQALLNTDDSNHLYKKWIHKYSSEDFQELARKTEDLLDKLSVSLTSEELDIIEKLYLQAMRLQIEFFTAQPVAQQTVIPFCKDLKPPEWQLLFFSDFDLTCSAVDSSAILAEIAIVTAPKSDQNQAESQTIQMSSAGLRNTWGVLSKEYTEEYEQCIDTILTSEKAEKFDYEGLCKALELLSDFEKKANAKVIESGVLKGVNLEDIKKAGERLVLQDGCNNFLQKLVQNGNINVNVHVLSYCWSGDLIRSAFSTGGLYAAVDVHSNEFIYEESISTGEIAMKVQSPLDKIGAFTNILGSFTEDKKRLTVYVGDSVGDLLCLLKADIGIVMGSSTSLRKVASHFGVSFVRLFEGLVRKQKESVEGSPLNWQGLSGVLYIASSWAEIQALILGS